MPKGGKEDEGGETMCQQKIGKKNWEKNYVGGMRMMEDGSERLDNCRALRQSLVESEKVKSRLTRSIESQNSTHAQCPEYFGQS